MRDFDKTSEEKNCLHSRDLSLVKAVYFKNQRGNLLFHCGACGEDKWVTDVDLRPLAFDTSRVEVSFPEERE